MTNDQQLAYEFIASEDRDGWSPTPMPFKLAKFRASRDSLVRAGLVVKTDTGRYVPSPRCGVS